MTLAALAPLPGRAALGRRRRLGVGGDRVDAAAPLAARGRGRGAPGPRGAGARATRAPAGCRGSWWSRGGRPRRSPGCRRPDAVFVGGGVGAPGVLEAAMAALRARRAAGGERGDAGRAGAAAGRGGAARRRARDASALARAAPVGGMTGWRPAMPVMQWAWRSRDGRGHRLPARGARPPRCWRRSRRRWRGTGWRHGAAALATVPAKAGGAGAGRGGAPARGAAPGRGGGGAGGGGPRVLSALAALAGGDRRAVRVRGGGAGAGGPGRAAARAAAGAGPGHLRARGRGGAAVTVHFIGAGPGAPDLITVRGRDLLARCPVCLYAGSIVPPALLAHCPPGARLDRHRAAVARRDRGGVRGGARRRAGRGAAALGRSLDLERGRRAGRGGWRRAASPTRSPRACRPSPPPRRRSGAS